MNFDDRLALLKCAEMAAADRATIEGGTSGIALMEAAGQAVADAVSERAGIGSKVAVLCGPGNNGGDGYVAARILKDAGCAVDIFALSHPAKLTGDARLAAERWKGPVNQPSGDWASAYDAIIDALFGAGLSRPVEGRAKDWVDAANASGALRVAVDMPSGISGDTGQFRGAGFEATVTVTFFRKKRGHLLMPGREKCGDILVADIGIADDVLADMPIRVFENHPQLFAADLKPLSATGHKYSRGHLVVLGGGVEQSGAARLAAAAGLRAGAGLVTIAAPNIALPVYAEGQASIMAAGADTAEALATFLADPRRTAVVAGPGNGIGDDTRNKLLAALALKKAVVIDADAITSFQDGPADLFSKIDSPVVFTPHMAEFLRLWPNLDPTTDKVEATRSAAKRANGVVVLKGPDTVIAEPGGYAIINAHAPPSLATAGSGDVLAGIIGGLLAQGMDAFSAAAAAVWLHGDAAGGGGRGLIAEDLISGLPDAFRRAGMS